MSRGPLALRVEVICMSAENGGGQSIIITDFKTQTTDILMPAQQMYMEHHAGDMPGRRRQGWSDIKPLADPSNPCAADPGTTCKDVGVDEVGWPHLRPLADHRQGRQG